jgi:hypothetical protein
MGPTSLVCFDVISTGLAVIGLQEARDHFSFAGKALQLAKRGWQVKRKPRQTPFLTGMNKARDLLRRRKKDSRLRMLLGLGLALCLGGSLGHKLKGLAKSTQET